MKKDIVISFLVVTLLVAPSAVRGDTFDGAELGDGWSFEDPNGNDAFSLTARPGWLQIQLSGPDEDVWSTGRGGAPFLRRGTAEGRADFSLETHVDLATSNGGYPVINAIGGLVV